METSDGFHIWDFTILHTTKRGLPSIEFRGLAENITWRLVWHAKEGVTTTRGLGRIPGFWRESLLHRPHQPRHQLDWSKRQVWYHIGAGVWYIFYSLFLIPLMYTSFGEFIHCCLMEQRWTVYVACFWNKFFNYFKSILCHLYFTGLNGMHFVVSYSSIPFL